MPDVEIVDRYGRRRRMRQGEIPQDGESISVPLALMDAAAPEVAHHLADKSGREHAMITDAYGYPAGHRRGYVFEKNRALADEAARAYDERAERKSTAWKRKGQPDDDEDDDRRLIPPAKEESAWLRRQALARKAAEGTMGRDARVTDLAQLRALADRAWEARNERLRNGWRKRDA